MNFITFLLTYLIMDTMVCSLLIIRLLIGYKSGAQFTKYLTIYRKIILGLS